MQRTCLRALCALGVFALFSAPSVAATLRVKADAPGPTPDGAAWETAFLTLTAALAAAAADDEIWVAAGEHTSTTGFTLRDRVSVYGGFAGTETRRDERSPEANVTVLTSTGIYGPGTVVTAPSDVTAETTLDGFTIQGGGGTGISGLYYGGGILCRGSSPVISNNVIINNTMAVASTLDGYGGGVAVLSGSPTLLGNLIKDNRVGGPNKGSGGAVAVIGGSITMRDNTIGTNTAARATGVYLSNATATLNGNLFVDQPAAVFAESGSTLTATGNTFRNISRIAVELASDASLTGNEFDNTGNTLSTTGIRVTGGFVTIESNTITGFQRSGIAVSGGASVMTANSIRNNGAVTPGGGISVTGAEVVIRANDLSGNRGTDGAAIYITNGLTRPLPIIEGNTIHQNVGVGSSGSVIYAGGAGSIVDNEFTDNTGTLIQIAATGPQGRTEIRSNRLAGSQGGSSIRVTRPGGLSNEVFVLANTISGSPSGPLYLSGGNVRFWNNRFTENVAQSNPAAISIYGVEVSVRDNLIAGNRITGEGVLMARGSVKGEIIGNTISDNTPISGGAFAAILTEGAHLVANNIVTFNPIGIVMKVTSPALRNNLVYGNTFRNYLDMPDPTGADGNISVDPVFVNRAAGNYRLGEGSPAINAGDDSVVLPGELDADMGARILGPHVDIGAFEAANLNPGLLADALQALRVAGGVEVATPGILMRLDTDTSGSVDIRDGLRIMRRAIGLETP